MTSHQKSKQATLLVGFLIFYCWPSASDDESVGTTGKLLSFSCNSKALIMFEQLHSFIKAIYWYQHVVRHKRAHIEHADVSFEGDGFCHCVHYSSLSCKQDIKTNKSDKKKFCAVAFSVSFML